MSKEVLVQQEENTNSHNNNINDNNNPMTPIAVGRTGTIIHDESDDETFVPVKQVFSFWAPLMQYDDANQSSLLLHYPTFTPIVGGTPNVPNGLHNNENHTIRQATAWQSLDATNHHFVNHPPIVELVD